MHSPKNVYAVSGVEDRLLKSFIVSLAGHLILFGTIWLNPEWRQAPDEYMPSVIDVQMVDISDAGGAAPAKKTDIMEDAPVEKEAPKEEAAEVEAPAPSDVKPDISISKSKPKPQKKTALKYKTFKSQKVLKSAVEKIEKEVQETPTRQLQDTIKRLREKVAETEKSTAGSGSSEGDATATGKSGTFAHGSRQEIKLIDVYRTDIAYQINGNWAFPEQMVDRSQKLMASLIFKVMPDGRIEDIFFVQRSGNQHLDDSAMKAIIKTSPVKPHPPELNRGYVEMGLNFTPQGVH